MDKLVYEAHLMRPDGTVCGCEILECVTEAEVLERAGRYAKQWASPVRLYQVPYVNADGQPWFADEVHFVAQLGPWSITRYRAGNRS